MSSEPTQVGSATGTPKTFEFTKRKRWADLLVTELADGTNLVLSKTRIILYCAPVITEMTGWKSADLLELSTYVDIKMDNDNLQRRHTELSKRLPQKAVTSPMTVAPIQVYATSPIQSTSNSTIQSGIDASSSYHPPSGSDLTEIDALLGTSFNNSLFTGASVPPVNLSLEDDNEDPARRKKLKKMTAGEQYGPLGPKTLCNACGLRWAKQTRTGKVEDTGDNVQYES
ncbi:hypothetical protein C0995_007180 [Termitomyces sp. Mi166|nr:hypothetical protein C0995_007180 [Termitomyces sp. Mi166\